jgi:hypothetical protein
MTAALSKASGDLSLGDLAVALGAADYEHRFRHSLVS